MPFCWPWEPCFEPGDRSLGPALLRNWPDPGAALAYARSGAESALAGDCPLRAREWTEALEFIEREAPAMRTSRASRVVTLRQFLEAMGVERG